MKKIAFIVNGKIRFKNGLVRKIGKHFKGNYQLEFFITEAENGCKPCAVDAIKSGFQNIICVGGDGSLNEVANGIMEARQLISSEESEQVRVGVLPFGSGNDFVKTLGLAFDIARLKKCIDNDLHKIIDLGLVKFSSLSGEESLRYFINITDVGLGGLVVKDVNRSSKLFGTFIAYQWAIIKSFIFFRHPHVKASADSLIYTGKVMNYIVANGKYFGSGLGIAPDAKPDDGIFSVVIIGEVSLAFYLKSLSDIRKGKRITHPQVYYEEAREVVVESTIPQPIDMDGEYIGNTPMKVRIIPKALKFICE